MISDPGTKDQVVARRIEAADSIIGRFHGGLTLVNRVKYCAYTFQTMQLYKKVAKLHLSQHLHASKSFQSSSDYESGKSPCKKKQKTVHGLLWFIHIQQQTF